MAAGTIEWWGHSDDMPATLGRSHVVCLPSAYGEGIPKSLLEAAACARPIVTTDAPGCREVVSDGVNGLLVPLKDPGALADALKRLIGDPQFGRPKRFGNEKDHREIEAWAAGRELHRSGLEGADPIESRTWATKRRYASRVLRHENDGSFWGYVGP